MNKSVTMFIAAIALSACALLVATQSFAAVGFSNMSSAGFRIINGGTSTLGGAVSTSGGKLAATNMQPYEARPASSDIQYWHDRAVSDLASGESFRKNSLSLVNADPLGSSPQAQMLQDSKLNYETAGLLANFAAIESGLISARNTFAYDLLNKFPDEATARNKLQESIRLLASTNIMIADEFLIDAVEYRFSYPSSQLGFLNERLDEQIALLQKAMAYYQKAIDTFAYGFGTTKGTYCFAATDLTDAEFSLFNLAVERLSMAIREHTSKLFVRNMSPDATMQWKTAREQAFGNLKDGAIATYLTTAALGESVARTGGDRIQSAFAMLQRQGAYFIHNLNPLGYDNRYIPTSDFTDLYNLAKNTYLSSAITAQEVHEKQKREFDSNKEKLASEINSLNRQYIATLSSFTGCTAPLDPQDTAQVETFLDCTGNAGADLLSCPATDDPSSFEACMSAKTTTAGVLAQKWRAIMQTHTMLNKARLTRQGVYESIRNENEKTGKLVELKRISLNTQLEKLNEYLNNIKREETDTVEKTTVRTKENGKWTKKTVSKTHTTTETFSVKDSTQKLNIQKEKDNLIILNDLDIKSVNLESAYRIKELMVSAAISEQDLSLAAQAKNSAVADFDNSMKEKEAQWILYDTGRDQLKYYTDPDRYATLRILQSQAAVDLSNKLNQTAHYAYLSAKALEYQGLGSLVDAPVGGGKLNITDVFKAQTPADLGKFLDDLSALNTQSCPWGTFDRQEHTVSLALHILGLTDGYLDPDGDGMTADGKAVADARLEKVQEFIARHTASDGSLRFRFGISEENQYLGLSGSYNMKIWTGQAPSPCRTLNSDQIPRGTTMSIMSTQSAGFRPKVRLSKIGPSSLRDGQGEIREYIPVYDYNFLFEGSGDYLPSKEVEFIPFTKVDPRLQSGTGSWTGAFFGMGITSSDWEARIFDWNAVYAKTNFSKIYDIQFFFDTLGSCCYQ